MIVWPSTVAAARTIQEDLARQVRIVPLDVTPRTVAGVDAAYRGGLTVAAAALFDCITLEPLGEAHAEVATTFPYVPGYLSFREGEAILAAIAGLPCPPDIILADGQGIAHPRRFGIASFLGVLLQKPAIGCAKSRLVGEYREPGDERGAWSPLVDRGEMIGAVLRTRNGVRPVFVSPGHLITLIEARDLVMRWTTRYRLPEPQRAADSLACRLAAEVNATARQPYNFF
ncbi:MAG TPA: endonuclease V [Geobacteraceae bacterium]